eukprot:2271996-Lingulodinium_polyedra.AAC.1
MAQRGHYSADVSVTFLLECAPANSELWTTSFVLSGRGQSFRQPFGGPGACVPSLRARVIAPIPRGPLGLGRDCWPNRACAR